LNLHPNCGGFWVKLVTFWAQGTSIQIKAVFHHLASWKTLSTFGGGMLNADDFHPQVARASWWIQILEHQVIV